MVTKAYNETMTLDDLHGLVDGNVLTPNHPGYEQARRGWNLSVDQYPALIVVAADAADVAAAVRYARDNYLGVAIQSTGHGVVKAANDAVLVITTRINQVRVNAEAQTAWVEAGAIWKQVLDAAQPHGLAPLLGSSPYVGVVGYTLGGGMGWLARKYGYSADSVNAIQVVTPDGRLRRASASENADLFWGLLGGGGNFGVVIGMEIKLYPVKVIYGGELMYPVELYADVLRFWREWITRVPDEMTSSVTLMSFPPIPQVPEPMRGKKFVQVKMGFVGAPEWGLLLAREWLEWVTPLQNTLHVMPFSDVGTISNDPVDPMPGYIANEMFDALSDAAIDVLVRYTTANSSPLVFTAIRHMGGAMAKADRSANAIGNRDALMVMETLGPTPTPEIEDHVVDYIADFKADLLPYTSGGNYLNFMGVREADDRTRDAYSGETYQRLMALKAKYDPENMFRYSFAIPVGEVARGWAGR